MPKFYRGGENPADWAITVQPEPILPIRQAEIQVRETSPTPTVTHIQTPAFSGPFYNRYIPGKPPSGAKSFKTLAEAQTYALTLPRSECIGITTTENGRFSLRSGILPKTLKVWWDPENPQLGIPTLRYYGTYAWIRLQFPEPEIQPVSDYSDDEDDESIDVEEIEINGDVYFIAEKGEIYNVDCEQVGEKPDDADYDAEPSADWLW